MIIRWPVGGQSTAFDMWQFLKTSRASTMAFAIMLVLLVIAIRVPFVSNILVGEEGCFADMILNDRQISISDEAMLPRIIVGSVQGQPLRFQIDHPIVPYLIIDKVGKAFVPDNALATLSPRKLTRAVRTPFLIIFMVGAAGLIILAATRSVLGTLSSRLERSIIALWVLSTPLAVGASIQPQVDGSVGVLLVGLASTLLVLSPVRGKRSLLCFVTAGILAALGKQEWAMAFCGGAVVTLVASFLFADGKDRHNAVRAASSVIIGIVIGTAISYGISPTDYMGGLAVMKQFYGMTGGRGTVLSHERFPTTYPIYALVGINVVLALVFRRKFTSFFPGVLIAASSGVGIAVGFAASGWTGDNFLRYFAPALIGLAVVLLAIWKQMDGVMPRFVRGVAVILTLAGIAYNIFNLEDSYRRKLAITSFQGTSMVHYQEKYAKMAQHAKDIGGVALDTCSFWVYNPNINWMEVDLDRSFVLSYIDQNYHDLRDKTFTEP